jgi:hypothetical protein
LFAIEIFDVMIEGQQFEFLGFTLNPVIRMAIMRKVCKRFLFHFYHSFIAGMVCVVLTDTRFSKKKTKEEEENLLFYCYDLSRK